MIDPAVAAANRRARQEKKAAYLRALHARYVDKFRAAATGEPVALAKSLHDEITQLLARDRVMLPGGDDIRCRKTCSHCCHEAVDVGMHEAQRLVAAARESGIVIDREQLLRQSRRTTADWHAQPAADRRCVFLDDEGSCRVYAARPASCRKLFVVSDPAECDATRPGDRDVERWHSWEVELMAAAALEVFGAELMAGALLRVLEAETAAVRSEAVK